MNKQEFIQRVMALSEYSDKELQLSNLINCDCNFISDMVNDIGDMLIVAVNPDLEGLAEDYFYETFWNNLGEADEDDWGSFYNALVEGAADPEYIARYS